MLLLRSRSAHPGWAMIRDPPAEFASAQIRRRDAAPLQHRRPWSYELISQWAKSRLSRTLRLLIEPFYGASQDRIRSCSGSMPIPLDALTHTMSPGSSMHPAASSFLRVAFLADLTLSLLVATT